MAAHRGACPISTGALDRIDIGTAERFAALTRWAGRTLRTAGITDSGVLRRTTGDTSATRTFIVATIATIATFLAADLIGTVTVTAASHPHGAIVSSIAGFTAGLHFAATLTAVCIAVR